MACGWKNFEENGGWHDMIVFTSICTNYVHKARTLAESVKKNIPDAKFFVCLTEREMPAVMEWEYFDKVI